MKTCKYWQTVQGLCYEITEPSSDGKFRKGDIFRRTDAGLERVGDSPEQDGIGIVFNGYLEENPDSADFRCVLWEWEEGRKLIADRMKKAGCREDNVSLNTARKAFMQEALACIKGKEPTESRIGQAIGFMEIARWLDELADRRIIAYAEGED